MSHKFFYRIFIFTALVLFFNCTVSKRHYRKGYHVAWHTKSSNNKKEVSSLKTEENSLPEDQNIAVEKLNSVDKTNELSASLNSSMDLVLNHIKRKPTFFSNDSCADVIVFRDGSEITVKIVEVFDGTVRYLPCNNLDGPLRVGNGEKIFMIKYANGTKEVFKDVAKKPVQTTVTERPEKKKINALAFISFICSIFGFFLLPAIAAFILGIIALNQIAKHPGKYKNAWMAKFGVVAGGIWLFLNILSIFATQ